VNTQKLSKSLAFLFGIGLALSISLTNVAWVTAGVLFLFYKIRRPDAFPWKKTGLELPMLVFAVWSLLRLEWGSPSPELLRNYKTALLLPLFFVVSQCFDEKSNLTWVRAFLWASVASAVLGCLQRAGGLNWDPTTGHREIPASLSFLNQLSQKGFRYVSLSDGRAMGTRSHPLTYSECLLPAFFLFLSPARNDAEPRFRWKPWEWVWAFCSVSTGIKNHSWR